MNRTCIFCPESFASLEEEMLHLFRSHHFRSPSMGYVKIGDEERSFGFFKKHRRGGKTIERWVRCICGKDFLCGDVYKKHAPPLPNIPPLVYLDEWGRHMHLYGSMAEHLQFLQKHAMLDKIAASGPKEVNALNVSWQQKAAEVTITPNLSGILMIAGDIEATWTIDPGENDGGQT